MILGLIKRIFSKEPKPHYPGGEFLTFTNPYNGKQITFFKSHEDFFKEENLCFKLYDWQIADAYADLERVNEALERNVYSVCVSIDINDIESIHYMFNPYTPKGKIKLNPCSLNARFRTKEGIPYGCSISYDIYDTPKTAHYSLAYRMRDELAYTIDLHYKNDAFHVTKVITTDSKCNNTKLYHIRKEEIT